MQTDRWVLPLNNKIETATWNGAEDEKFHGFLTCNIRDIDRVITRSAFVKILLSLFISKGSDNFLKNRLA